MSALVSSDVFSVFSFLLSRLPIPDTIPAANIFLIYLLFRQFLLQ
ncbi:hypothetical protein LsR_01751 (plasmid) [Ligilactobacillus salivarius str. Ren]|uniref:Uncharacterized protein n=1 Tax=Ligilactobacillus salivarius str. Ren TaxID=1194971 RepID=A0A0F7Q177_9LACO|nr:hypothetical protein LsR_01751 [Ligilactobacillus salivarius str. Ren]